MKNYVTRWRGLPVTGSKDEQGMHCLYEPKFRLAVPKVKTIEEGLQELDNMLLGIIGEYVLCDANTLTPHAKLLRNEIIDFIGTMKE